MKRARIRNSFIILLILIPVLLMVSICIGSVNIGIGDMIPILTGRVRGTAEADIVMAIRFPRAIAAFIIGGALALSGYALQTFFRNPIAGPYILGISTGAKLTVAVFLVFSAKSAVSMGFIPMILAAFLGALLATGFVLICSLKVRDMALLLVCGVMTGYICSAVTDIVVNFAQDSDIVNLHNWSKGSVSGLMWDDVAVMTIITGICFILMLFLSKPMSAYLISESYAKSLGVNVLLFRVFLILSSSILSATVTAFSGPISFVGIAVPQLIRNIFKSERPLIMIPACFVGGGLFCIVSDLVARMMFSPLELSISTVTAAFGAPIVVWMLLKRRSIRD